MHQWPSIIWRTLGPWWLERLSMMTVSLGLSLGTSTYFHSEGQESWCFGVVNGIGGHAQRC